MGDPNELATSPRGGVVDGVKNFWRAEPFFTSTTYGACCETKLDSPNVPKPPPLGRIVTRVAGTTTVICPVTGVPFASFRPFTWIMSASSSGPEYFFRGE